MNKIIICILFLFLAIDVKIHGMTLYSTFDTNSTEGNYYGSIYFSFSSTNSSDYQYDGPQFGDQWIAHQSSQTFTDAVSGAQISIGLEASGFGETGGELDLLSIITVNDPTLGTLDSGLGNGYSGSSPYDESPGAFNVGQPSAISYKINDFNTYYSFTLNMYGTCTFGYSLTGSFDGTSGSAVGSWYVNYTTPTPVPEPVVTLQLALGGFCFWLAHASTQRRRKLQDAAK